MKERKTVLVVDDDRSHRIMLRTLVGGWGYQIFEADDGGVAIDLVKERYFDLVLMDIRMVKVSGIEALSEIRRINPAIPVIIMTAYSSVETAVETLKKGAYDYLTKPLEFDKLKLTMERAVEHLQLKKENRVLKQRLGKRFDSRNIIGSSRGMVALLETVAMAAPSEANVLISGESGTGKEQIAAAVHYNSPRKEGPFIKINCAAITETLFESELFGHEKGAFTGADKRKDGSFLLASGGSLFLDEISEMPLSMQVKLLRVLQEREITRVGGSAVIKTDVRIIAATNKDLLELSKKGEFREDLYYRLNVINLNLPALRERKDDIPLLAQHFLSDFAERNRKKVTGFSPEAMNGLVNYNWPGNVRELMNSVERAVVLARGEVLHMGDMPFLGDGAEAAPEGDAHVSDIPLSEVEKNAILRTLASCDGNKSEAARRLGITRKTLHKKLKDYDVM